MTKSDFGEWKAHPVTREIFSAWRNRRVELAERLVEMSAYGDPRELAQTAAAVKVYDEILNMEGPDGY